MDKYLLASGGLIVFSLMIILCVRIFEKTSTEPDKNLDKASRLEEGEDFTILE